MEKKHKEMLTKYLPDFVAQVDPQQLLTYLSCLSTYTKETIDTAQSSKSRSYAAQVLHGHLERRPEGFEQLVKALRHENVGCTALADLLDPGHSFDLSNRGQNQEQRNNNKAPSCHQGNQVGCNNVPHGATGLTQSSPRIHNLPIVRSSPNHWQIKSPAIYEINTPWEKLPGSVISILRKFDAHTSMKTIADLGDVLEFNVGEIKEIESAVPSGESKTLGFLERWIQMQSKPVTLGDIMLIFHRLDRKDIIHDLQNKTGVMFEQEEENGDSTQVDNLSDQARHRTSFTDSSQNMNVPTEKISEKVLNLEATMMCQNREQPGNNERTKAAETYRQMQQEDCEIRSIVDDSIDDCKKNEMIIPYRREDIENKSRPDLQIWKGESLVNCKMDQTISLKKLSRISSEPGNSGGFLCLNTCQNENEIQENNLNRSTSTCSSNTENNSYDSLPVTHFENSLQSGDENMPLSPKVCIFNNDEDEHGNGGNIIANSNEIADLGQRDSMHEKESIDKFQEIKDVDEHQKNGAQHRNVWQQKESSQNNGINAEELEAKFSEEMFQQKILGNWQTYSDIISQSDASESRRVSEKICSRSVLSRLVEENKIHQGHMESSCVSTEYVDHSLLDEEANKPKLPSLSGEMKSLQKKASKPFPGQNQCYTSSDNAEFDNDFDDNPTGSFKFDWQLQSEDFTAVSIDGETDQMPLEQTSLRNHQSETLLDKPADEAGEKEEFKRRGPSSLVLPEEYEIKKENEKVDENVFIQEYIADQSRTCLESGDVQLEIVHTDIPQSNTNLKEVFNSEVMDEESRVAVRSHETENSEINTHGHLGHQTRFFNDLEMLNLKDSFRSICCFVKLVYENSI